MTAFHKKTIEDISGDIRGLRTLVRMDWNVPGDHSGAVTDDFRIRKSLDTIFYLQKLGCKVVIISHRGRPEGKVVEELSLRPVAKRAEELLDQKINFIDSCADEKAYQAAVLTKPGEITVLENLRFHPGETKNEENFAKSLSMMGEVFVQNGFGVVHRAHASTEGVTHWLASVAGLLLEREYTIITEDIDSPERPLVAVIGGAKISDKIDLVNKFLEKADNVVIGGAMANTFLKAQGKNIGESIYEEGSVEVAKEILNAPHAAGLVLMTDAGVGTAKHISKKAPRENKQVDELEADDIILDVAVSQEVVNMLNQAGTVVWNGNLGYTEAVNFTSGSAKVAEVLAASSAKTTIGGGDTVGFIVNWDINHGDSYYHVSTGGGASLELMSGHELPGVEALLDKD